MFNKDISEINIIYDINKKMKKQKKKIVLKYLGLNLLKIIKIFVK